MSAETATTMFVEFYVTDMKYYTYFFCHVLHFAVEKDEGHYVELIRGHDKILLNSDRMALKPSHHFYKKLDVNENGIGIEVGFVVKDLEAAYERAKIFQTVKLTEITSPPRSQREFHAVLPDSYYLCVTEAPHK